MKVSNNKGVANHIGPESCAVGSNPYSEALTGERAGWVLSHETRIENRAPTRSNTREGHTARAIARARSRLCGVRDPEHARKHFERESGEPVTAQQGDGLLGCKGKSKDASQ